jgi:hypothetical protein
LSKILKNTTASAIVVNDVGYVNIAASPGSYTIPPQDYLLWAASSNVITFIGAGDLVVNDGSVDLNISDGTDLIKGLYPRNYVYDPADVQILTATLANTEYSYAFPAGTRAWALQHRSGGMFRHTFTALQTGTQALTLYPGAFWAESNYAGTTLTLYYRSPTAGSVLELRTWT